MISEDNLCDMLFHGTNSFMNFLQFYGILVNLVDMPGTVQGFIYISLKGEYHIVINDNLSSVMKRRILLHELKHIFEDFPKLGSVIGLDFQHIKFEDEADIFAKNILKKLTSKTDEGRKAAIGR